MNPVVSTRFKKAENISGKIFYAGYFLLFSFIGFYTDTIGIVTRYLTPLLFMFVVFKYHRRFYLSIESKLFIIIYIMSFISVLWARYYDLYYKEMIGLTLIMIIIFMFSFLWDNTAVFEGLLIGVIVTSYLFIIYFLFNIGGKISSSFIYNERSGGIVDPNTYGYYFYIAIFSFLYFFNKTESKKLLIISIISIFFYFIIVIISASRGGFIMVLFSTLTFFMIVNKSKNIIFKMLLFGLLGYLMYYFLSDFILKSTYLGSRFTDVNNYSRYGRGTITINAWNLFIDNFYKGVGAGNVRGYIILMSHNSFLELGASIGVIGFLLYILILGLTIYKILKTRKRIANEKLHIELTIWLLFFLAFIAYSNLYPFYKVAAIVMIWTNIVNRVNFISKYGY